MTAELDYAVLTSTRQEPQLLPRYRRVLTFGDVLDESVQIFRQHWVSFALVSAVSLLPPGLIGVWLGASGALTQTVSLAEIQSGRLDQNPAILAEMVALFATAIISTFFVLLWTSAVVGASDGFLHGTEPRIGPVYVHAVRRYWAVFLASVLVLVALIVLTMLAIALFVLTGFGIAGSLIALVAMLFWWLKPAAQRSWLKWLIVAVAPFGLPTYPRRGARMPRAARRAATQQPACGSTLVSRGVDPDGRQLDRRRTPVGACDAYRNPVHDQHRRARADRSRANGGRHRECGRRRASGLVRQHRLDRLHAGVRRPPQSA